MEKIFYDIHMHAMNLSHPNLLAFLQRYKGKLSLALLANSLLGPAVSFVVGKKLKEMKNLLSVMENDLGSFFLLMEECLSHPENQMLKNGQFYIGGNVYEKIILTPLMMDFGYKDIESPDIHYSRPLHKSWQKPIVEQVVDVFNGIKKYKKEKPGGIFEIYPFLALNTKNYTKEEIEEMLDKYFGDYNRSPDELRQKIGAFDGDIEKMGSNFFAGIKVYPPLGFDPWPEDNAREFEKVSVFYKRCCDKNIPVTTHCSEGGFMVAKKKDASAYTSPAKWKKVLENFPSLKLNLAHFGRQDNRFKFFPVKAWRQIILGLISKYQNVYVDFSYSGVRASYYKFLRGLMDAAPDDLRGKLKERVLFGTDFMINLGGIESYNEYLKIFSDTGDLTAEEKDKFCSLNPQKFLF